MMRPTPNKPFTFALLVGLVTACGPIAQTAPTSADPPAPSAPADVPPSNGGDDGADAPPADKAPGPNDTQPVLPCDAGFRFAPASPETGSANQVRFWSDLEGYVYVGLELSGPGRAVVGTLDIEGSAETGWTWSWPVRFETPGTWSATFTAEMGARAIGYCEFSVADTGPPPADGTTPLPPSGPAPDPNCAGKVCGESDGAGGTCSRCLMVASEGGACMDPPSPITPGGQASWSCLDNAGCTKDGACRIWCPGEKCLHPSGKCPQGVHAVWVDPRVTDYEEACRSGCQAREHWVDGQYLGNACWDDAWNVCRYPGHCYPGSPPPIPE